MPDLLDVRERTHGQFSEIARFVQAVKFGMRSMPGWQRLTAVQRETLDANVCKFGRILSGDNNFLDHWEDIVGYTRLALKELEAMSKT